jgi:hypothetical protein
MAIDKSKWNTKNKVSQSMIDDIKKQGMSAALKQAATSNNSKYVEGVRRLYTDERLNAARRAAGSRASNPDAPKVSKSAPVPRGSRARIVPVPDGSKPSVSARPSSSGSGARLVRVNPTSKVSDYRYSKNNPNGNKTPALGMYRGSSGKVATAKAEADANKVLGVMGTIASAFPAGRVVGGAYKGARFALALNKAKPVVKAAVKDAMKARTATANAAIKASIEKDVAAKAANKTASAGGRAIKAPAKAPVKTPVKAQPTPKKAAPAKAPAAPKVEAKPAVQTAKPTKVKPIEPALTNKQKVKRIGAVGATGYFANEYNNRKRYLCVPHVDVITKTMNPVPMKW